MQVVNCTGTPSEIGFQHGQTAADAIHRGLIFYENLFLETTKLSWMEVCYEASKFLPVLTRCWPHYVEEMHGVSRGAGVLFQDILALNVRTEIAYGMFSDGCTALSWKSDNFSALAQNWDWQSEQAENLVHLRIRQDPKPSIDMISEAGIIGKIGLNSTGVGVCLNAIRARGVDFDKLPVHLALRACLDSNSRTAAVTALEKAGVASSCHILVADAAGGIGLECSYKDVILLEMSDRGVVTHTNHFVEKHPGVEERIFWSDSLTRLGRINHLIQAYDAYPRIDAISMILNDEQDFPVSICRAQTEMSTSATLFSVTMRLDERKAIVIKGRPVDGGKRILLDPTVNIG